MVHYCTSVLQLADGNRKNFIHIMLASHLPLAQCLRGRSFSGWPWTWREACFLTTGLAFGNLSLPPPVCNLLGKAAGQPITSMRNMQALMLYDVTSTWKTSNIWVHLTKWWSGQNSRRWLSENTGIFFVKSVELLSFVMGFVSMTLPNPVSTLRILLPLSRCRQVLAYKRLDLLWHACHKPRPHHLCRPH